MRGARGSRGTSRPACSPPTVRRQARGAEGVAAARGGRRRPAPYLTRGAHGSRVRSRPASQRVAVDSAPHLAYAMLPRQQGHVASRLLVFHNPRHVAWKGWPH